MVKETKIKADSAKEYLSDVKKEQHFCVHLGTNIGNLFELKEALEIMSDQSFNHHVNSHKNDFATWVKNVVKDKALAEELQKSKSKSEMIELVSKRIDDLELTITKDGTFNEDKKDTMYDFILGMIVGFIIGLIVAMLR